MPTFEVVLSARPSNVRSCTQNQILHWKDTKDGVYISPLIEIYMCWIIDYLDNEKQWISYSTCDTWNELCMRVCVETAV